MTFTQPGATAPRLKVHPRRRRHGPRRLPQRPRLPRLPRRRLTSTATATSAGTTPSGAWPDASNTGVPDGVTLTNYTGPATITTPGTVIDGKKVTSCLVIEANDVTIKNSLLQSGCFFNVDSYNGNTGLKLTDVEIDGLNSSASDSAINAGGFICMRCDIHDTGDGIKAGNNAIIQDSWIHDLAMYCPRFSQ